MGGCLNKDSGNSDIIKRVHTEVIIDETPIDFREILVRLDFRRRFLPLSLAVVWPDNPVHKFIDNHSLLTIFHLPSINPRDPSITVAKCYDPDLYCNSTNIFMCPYRWRLNDGLKKEFCYEIPESDFRELRNLIQEWHEKGYSLRLVKKLPGSDKPQANKLFPNDGRHLHCVLQCVFQNCDLGVGYKILGMPWTHKFAKHGWLDYDFPDIASELSRYGRMGFRICGIFGAVVQIPKRPEEGLHQRILLHFMLEKMPDRIYRFKQSVFLYHQKSDGRAIEMIGNINDWIYSFTSRGWVLGASMKMPSQPDHHGCKIPELLVFQTSSEEVI